MRTLSVLAAAVALAVLPALPAAAADADSGERITSYGVDLQVRADGSMQVRETIAYDFGGNAKHGIERKIDTQEPYDGSHNRRYPLTGVQATSDNAAPVEITHGDRTTTVRIGDPDRTITGRHTYTVSYTVEAATTRYGDRDELYWNAVGPDWTVPVDDIDVRVSGAQVTRSTCYAGKPGTKTACGSAEGGSFGQDALAAGEALTVVAAFPPGSVADAAPVLVDRQTLGRYVAGNPAVAVPGVLLALGGPVWFLVATVRRKRAREAPGLPYRQQFQPQPPPGMRPLFANTVLGGLGRPVDGAAVLLDLSARGFVSVTPAGKKDWRLVAVRAPDGSVPPEGHEVFQAAFRNGPDTTLRAAAKPLRQIHSRLAAMAKDGVVEQGWFSRRPSRGGGLTALAIVMFLAGIPVTVAAALVAHAAIIGPALLIGGIVLLVGTSLRSQPRTEAGEIARSQLMAFKETLRRIDPGQVPADQREAVLGSLLPYAVVLGLAPQLAAAFSAAGVVAGGYAYASNPMWWSTFSSDATSATTPSSSGSSSSGGGFSGSSGGGGGGGGGGSW